MERSVTCATLSQLVAGRSEIALLDVRRLRALGIEAALLEGGIEAWKAAGGAVGPAQAGDGR
jgi:hypothetical protein